MKQHKCDKEQEITQIKNNQIQIKEDLKETMLEVKSIKKRLFGNGVKGIIQKLDEVCDYMLIQNDREKQKSKLDKLTREELMTKLKVWGVISVILFFFLQILWEIIKIKMFGG